jgi:GT2 family glycosyltransferase
MTKVSVIIVSYKVKDLVTECVRSVLKAGETFDLEIFVVDNASEDGTVEQIRREFPSVKVIANDQNLGFSKANNQALPLCFGEIVLLLNPDTVLHENALNELVHFFGEQTGGAVVGLNVRNSDGTYQSCVHTLPDLRAVIFSVLGLDRMFPRSSFFNAWAYAGAELTEVRQVGHVTGAALAMNRAALEVLEGLDENLFYWDDADVCCRAWKSGLPVFSLPQAKVTHLCGASASRNVRWTLYFQHVSRVRYFRKHHGWVAVNTVMVLTFFELCFKVLVRSVQWLAPSRRPECRQRLAAYLDALSWLVRRRAKQQVAWRT